MTAPRPLSYWARSGSRPASAGSPADRGAVGFLNPVLGAVIFERIPDRLVGRVSSMTTPMCFALMPFGGLLGGALVSWQGLSFAMLATGAAYFVVTMLPAVDPRWREMDRRPEPETVPVET